MSVINTNITSMIGQSNLSKSQSALQTSMERLSSGLRINSAKDDAAGQAIANRMTAQITGLAQAQRNANDGISIAQTAEGALNQVNDNLQRIRELSVQAANGSNSQKDLTSIQEEITQRLNEIDRISDQTDFNGVKVLKAENNLKVQVGANDNESITVNLKQINSTTLGLSEFNVNNTYVGTEVKNDSGFTIDGVTFDGTGGKNDATDTLTYKDANGDDLDGTPSLYQDDAGNLYIKDGEDYYAASAVGTKGTKGDGTDTSITITQGEKVLNPTEVKAESRTSNPLAALDSALNQVDTLRSELGAVQNRFEDAITNLRTNETNLSAARSRIEDADYAVEVANMTRAQILQQAGTSVLAQANQIPQNVLSLLG